ncbi:MAG TPA: MMPL family transporter, partial [Halanaerobiales bacterium]|nr:MMPL family transporter [Halanaerobiales bacterium]
MSANKRFNKFVLDNPILIIAILVVITLFFAGFIPRISFDASLENMVPEDDPVIKDLQDAVEDFGSQSFFMVAFRSDNIFRAETLEKIHKLGEEIKDVPGVEKVSTPLTVDIIKSDLMGIEIRPVTDKLPRTEGEIEEFRQQILNSSYVGQLITDDGKGAAIIVTPESFGELNSSRTAEISSQIDQLVSEYRGAEEIYIVGDAYSSYYAEQAMQKDIKTLLPLIILVLILILYWSFHSLRGVWLPLSTVL